MTRKSEIDSLRLAAKSLDLLAVSQSLAEAERHWTDFLTYLDRFSNHMLALKSSALQQSVSRMGTLRANDPLLMYLRHARNSTEHTLREIVEVVKGADGGGGTTITGGLGGGTIFSGTIIGGEYPTQVKMKNMLVRYGPDRLELVNVLDRNGNIFPVPTEHLGRPISTKVPLELGKLGLSCYQQLFPDFV